MFYNIYGKFIYLEHMNSVIYNKKLLHNNSYIKIKANLQKKFNYLIFNNYTPLQSFRITLSIGYKLAALYNIKNINIIYNIISNIFDDEIKKGITFLK